MPTPMKPTILVVGGGFAGRSAIRTLDDHGDEFRVVHVDEKPFFEFTPSILRCIVQPAHLHNITFPHDDSDERIFAVGRVTLITPSEATIKRHDGNRITYISVPFDYCIWATGVSFTQPIHSGHTYDEVCTIQKRHFELERYRLKCTAGDEILVVGGGLVGVELCAELTSLLETQKKTRITLACSPRGLLPRLPERAGKFAEKWLSKRGVKTVYARVRPDVVDDGGILRYVSDSDPSLVLRADVVFNCCGAKSNGAAEALVAGGVIEAKFVRADGSISVQSTLQVWDVPHFFVAGDASYINGEFDMEGLGCEKTAYAAEESGKLAALNVMRTMRGERLVSRMSTRMKRYPINAFPFGKFPRLFVVSLYKYDGILCLGPLVVCGKLPALFKAIIEFLGVRSARINGVWSFIFRYLEYIAYVVVGLLQLFPKSSSRPAVD
eukprot:gb/GEZJ01001690.1/.p1 GENE.gb/GEZJ01001690.1/~~gb/GEZJ01001690.1/.p1  ORF type:complete len:438 (+),score=43.12 gb/GEZJ01001690.1/:1386-2699(+)